MKHEMNMSRKFLDFKDDLVKTKKYLLIYLIFILITCLSTISQENIAHPKFEIIMFLIVAFLGISCIIFYFNHNSEKELHYVAFVIIICFGLITSFIVPIVDVSDESEHLVRAEITSRGIFFPHWTGEDLGLETSYNITSNGDRIYNEAGFITIDSMDFFDINREVTVFDVSGDTDKINNSEFLSHSAFEQNPFYGYLPQAIGILIAKFLDLNVIWLLWLARLGNLVCYAGLISLAIKKTPVLKFPLLAISCIPITIYQASSVSIDSMIFGLGILAVSFFIFICKSNNLSKKNIITFSVICLLLGLCKLPYLAFIFLLLFIPKDNFKNKHNIWFYILLCILFVGILGLIWSKYASPTLLHSWRPIQSNFNSTAQINFLINHPNNFVNFILQTCTMELQNLFNGFFNFYHGTPGPHYYDNYTLITLLLQIFLMIMLFAYPKNVHFDLKSRMGALVVMLIIYFGTCFIQLLTWSDVGKINLGISLRYFIPLLAFIPIIFNLNYKNRFYKNFDCYSIVFIIDFMATLVLAFTTQYY